MPKRLDRLLCIGFALGVAACGGADDTTVSVDCLPGSPLVLGNNSQSGLPDRLDLYLDVSQSSTNFGASSQLSPYRDLIGSLLSLQSELEDMSTFGFAERIAPVDEQVIAAAARGQVNPCGEKCGFRETRLDEVLDRLSVDTTAPLSVIITDLWLDNSEILGRGAPALSRPVGSILESGRAIGVLGVASPYDLRVFDIPTPDGQRTLPAGRIEERPFFALVIGKPEDVRALQRRIENEAFFASDSERHFTLFSPRAFLSGPQTLTFGAEEADQTAEPAFIMRLEGDEIPSFTIDPIQADKIRSQAIIDGQDDSTIFAGLVAPISTVEASGSPNIDSMSVEANFWSLSPPEPQHACEASAWMPIDLEGAVRAIPTENGPVIGLDISHPDMLGLARGEILFGRYKVNARSVAKSGGNAAWMNEWSFQADQGQSLLGDPPDLFPTLNVHEFREMLEREMSEQITGETMAGGSVLLIAE